MSKLLKISLLFIILFSTFTNFSQAETTNLYNDVSNEETSQVSSEDSTENTTQDNATNEDSTFNDDDDIDFLNDSYTRTTQTPASNNSARVSTVSSISEANLGLNNILCIILIALGILLVLLAIAILIRLKK